MKIEKVVRSIYINNAKETLKCELILNDSCIIQNIIINKYIRPNVISNDWKYVINNYGEDKILKETEKVLIKDKKNKKRHKYKQEREADRLVQFKLFEYKQAIYDNEIFKKIKSKVARIRVSKSKNEIEAMIYASASISDELMKD